MRTSQSGLTIVEVLVSLTVFAILAGGAAHRGPVHPGGGAVAAGVFHKGMWLRSIYHIALRRGRPV